MRLNELYPFPEERKKRKRVGRGRATGKGGTAGKGHKGQNCRSGGGVRPGFEGGQMPLQRRLPKRGFKNPFREAYAPLNLDRLAKVFEGRSEITLDDIYAKGLCKNGGLVKILGVGEAPAKVTVEAHRFSASAREKITSAGGQARALEG